MKVTVKIRYPYVAYYNDTVSIEVPDEAIADCDGDIQMYLDEEQEAILKAQGAELSAGLEHALDIGRAYVHLMKEAQG